MKTTGITTLDHAPQEVAAWLNELGGMHDGLDRGRAYLLFRTVLHALRDFLTVTEAANLAAQLPVLVRGIYYEGWRPAATPVSPRSKEAFLQRVELAFARDPLDDPEGAVTAVFDLLRRHISAGEVEHIARALRRPLRELWA